MKSIIVFLALLLSIYIASAQEVIATAGDFQQAGGYSLSWTLGECVTETVSGSANTLTQGFQQPWVIVTQITENNVESEIRVFPNPVDEILHISSNCSNMKLMLFDATGKLILEETTAENTFVSMAELNAGVYILFVETNGYNEQSFRIIKND